MPSIKENIKEQLLTMISEEYDKTMKRLALSESSQESFQIMAERNFLNKLEEFVRSL